MESSPTALAQSIAVPIEICQQAIIETLLESMPEQQFQIQILTRDEGRRENKGTPQREALWNR
jgi:hypothetical protein